MLWYRWAASTVMTRQNEIPDASQIPSETVELPGSTLSSESKPGVGSGGERTDGEKGEGKDAVEGSGRSDGEKLAEKKLLALIPLWDLCNHTQGHVSLPSLMLLCFGESSMFNLSIY